MKSPGKVLRIKRLKLKAKGLYTSYNHLCSKYDCGKDLSQFLNPDIIKIKDEFNEVMKKLKELDPDCPDFNLH
jgi:hypothetical protein